MEQPGINRQLTDISTERPDGELVERARSGDREAFGELLRRHYAGAYRYAKSIARDEYAAEDIVQNALMKAFLHLGTLMDAERFTPWLNRIVKHQAYNELRKIGKERTMTDVESFYRNPHYEGGSLEHILDRLIVRHSDETADPAELWLRRETIMNLRQLLACLTKRERAIFEAYFFSRLTPREIAELLQTTAGNVYMVLSRSRKKLMQERVRSYVRLHVQKERKGQYMKRVLLNKPRTLHWKSRYTWSFEPWTTAGFNLYGLLETTACRDLTITEVMGLTGQAFRLNLVNRSIHTAGAVLYDWNRVLPQCARLLGFDCRMAGKPTGGIGPAEAVWDLELLGQALDLIRDSIDRGHPVLSFDLTLPEFGVIYGYDDECQLLYVGDVNTSFHRAHDHHEALPYDKLGRTFTGNLFVMSLTDGKAVTFESMLLEALKLILDHADGKEPAFEGCSNGIAAYDEWIASFRERKMDLPGTGYTVSLVYDARRYAAQFLKELADRTGDAALSPIEPLALQAGTLYSAVAERFEQLRTMFPFGGGGLDPNEHSNAEKAIVLLEEAKRLEVQGLGVLREMRDRLAATRQMEHHTS